MSEDIVYLVDGSGIYYRSFFALNLSNSKGFPTGAVYGFMNALRKIDRQYNPVYIGVCFDVSRKTFRQEKYREYKINRPPVPDRLSPQIPVIKKLTACLGLAVIEREGFEADDIIASLTKESVEKGLKVVIVSSDKDMFQLIDKDIVRVYDPAKNRMFNEEGFIKEYGFNPGYMVDYLSLAGDTSDNIPGAAGIGKVGAAGLVRTYGEIKAIFENIADLPKGIREKLLAGMDNVRLSRDLVALMTFDTGYSLDTLKRTPPDRKELYSMFKELEFKSLIKNFSPGDEETLAITCREVPEGPAEPFANREELIFFPCEEYIYVFTGKDNPVYKIDRGKFYDLIKDERILKISYDCKNFIRSLGQDVDFHGKWFDVKIAGHLVNPLLTDFSLRGLIHGFLDKFPENPSPDLSVYFIGLLYEVLSRRLEDAKMMDLFFNEEMPLVEVLAGMERWGINIDLDFLSGFSRRVKQKLEKVRDDIFSLAGKEFNLNSPAQLGEVLFVDLGISPLKKIKTGFSTNEKVLAKLSSNHEIAGRILEYRQLNKLYSGYLKPFTAQARAGNGRIFASFNQTNTVTGRLSSSSPNLQNIPVKSEFSKEFRKAVIPSFPGGVIISCDYSQIELRILAHMSDDEKLIDAFRRGDDIHSYTAALLFDLPQARINSEQRAVAKKVNFGIVYGISPFGLSQELNISQDQAAGFIDSYFNRYPGVKQYIDRICATAREQGRVETILGRVRFLPDIQGLSRQSQEFNKRAAVNTPVQGSAAEIIKLAMINVYRRLNEQSLNSKIIIQVHDELIFDVCPEEEEEVTRIARQEMESAMRLKVPLRVKINSGKNWYEAG